MEQVRHLFGPGAEIAESSIPVRQRRFKGRPGEAIAALVRNRPVTLADIERSVGIDASRARAALKRLTKSGRVTKVRLWGKVFYESPERARAARRR